jgi:S-adenosylmethionine:tRNA ribosyltransferase-isomerase
MLHRRLGPETWRAFARPAKRLEPGDSIRFGDDRESTACFLASLDAKVEEKLTSGELKLRFALTGAALDEAVIAHGEMPLPPYIARKRATDERDLRDYQTVYAAEEGAVAAPTAGLHMTEDLLRRLERRGVTLHRVTLHVGAGTFLPVKAEDTEDHRMHPEWGRIDEATASALNVVRQRGGRIVAVGTTSLRLLESAVNQDRRITGYEGWTDIFITPGYRFRAADLLLTNFHLPRSTLFMLVSAFAGLDRMRDAYRHAIAGGYRFYSYGDACLLEGRERA